MKKLIVIGIVMVMALSATAAFAAIDNDWLVNLKCSNDALAKVGSSNAIFGLKTAAGDSYNTMTTPMNLINSPEVNFSHPSTAYTSRYYIAKKGGAPLPVTQTWNFRIAGDAGATVYLTAWNGTGATNLIDAGTTQTIQIFEANAQGEKVGDAVWSFIPGTTASWTASGGIVGVANTNYFSKAYTLSGNYQNFVLVAAVPEPGSMVALFSGLVGLVGFGIRRRK